MDVDMWTLVRRDLERDDFASLVAGAAAKVVLPSSPERDKVEDGFSLRRHITPTTTQICTESLGCESCDSFLEDAVGPENCAVDDEQEDTAIEGDNAEDSSSSSSSCMKRGSVFQPPTAFPPAMASCSSLRLRSLRKDGRFQLVVAPAPVFPIRENFSAGGVLRHQRRGGRLVIQILPPAQDIPEESVRDIPEESSRNIPAEDCGKFVCCCAEEERQTQPRIVSSSSSSSAAAAVPDSAFPAAYVLPGTPPFSSLHSVHANELFAH